MASTHGLVLDKYHHSNPIDYTEPATVRIRQAVAFLREYPNEEPAPIARLYMVPLSSLYSALQRPTPYGRGGNNRILLDHHTIAIHNFIRSLLCNGIKPTQELIYGTICKLREDSHPNKGPPSKQWFYTWWKKNHLHKIKSKPIPMVRFYAQEAKKVKEWFLDYVELIRELGIKRKDIWNFDEGGFRSGCDARQEILVPDDVYEVSYYSLS